MPHAEPLAYSNLIRRSCPTLFVLTCATTALAQPILYVDVAADGSNVGTSWGDAYNDLQDALDHARRPGAKIAGHTHLRTNVDVIDREGECTGGRHDGQQRRNDC